MSEIFEGLKPSSAIIASVALENSRIEDR